MHLGLVAPPDTDAPNVRCIDATIGGLVTGRYRPVTDRRRYAVVNPFGMGLLDVALLHEIQRRAISLGLGTALRMG
jgi:ornithine cyclodeaminase